MNPKYYSYYIPSTGQAKCRYELHTRKRDAKRSARYKASLIAKKSGGRACAGTLYGPIDETGVGTCEKFLQIDDLYRWIERG